MVWAACGIATCTTRREFSRFWAAHGQCSERTSVYALGIHDDGTVVNWGYGLAVAMLSSPPLKLFNEETWPEQFNLAERLAEVYSTEQT